VVDCSIFPNIVTGNTNAAAIATGMARRGTGASGRWLSLAVPPVRKCCNDLGRHRGGDDLWPLVGDLAADRADQF
jgi:hypothetical protein